MSIGILLVAFLVFSGILYRSVSAGVAGRIMLVAVLSLGVIFGLYFVRHGSIQAPAIRVAVVDEASDQHIVAERESPAGPPLDKVLNLPAEAESPTPRPAWVDSPPTLQADGTLVSQVSVGPYASIEECQGKLDAAIRDAVDRYIDNSLWQGQPDASRVELPMVYIREHIARPHGEGLYLERREHSFGNMYTLHARLAFERQVQDHLHDLKQQAVVNRRLQITGLGSLLTLAALGTVFGYLKLDTATKGYYTRRLQAGAALIALALIAAAVLGFA